MEDSHIAHLNFHENAHLFGVFDGHGGHEVACYIKDKFLATINKQPSLKTKDYANALKETFIALDDEMRTPQGIEDLKVYKKPEQSTPMMFSRPTHDNPAVHAGATATAIIVTETHIYCANAGDSRTVLSEAGVNVDLSEDHKPDNAGEKARIEKAGGFVEESRVKGVLALSRAIGDLEYKAADLPHADQMISPVPDLKTVERNDKHDYVMLACDGIWDCMTSAEVISYVQAHYKNPEFATAKHSVLIENLFEKIIAPDVASSGGIGCDNMTAIIVKLK